MTTTFHVALVFLGLICLLAASFDSKFGRVNLLAAGLFLWLLSTVVFR